MNIFDRISVILMTWPTYSGGAQMLKNTRLLILLLACYFSIGELFSQENACSGIYVAQDLNLCLSTLSYVSLSYDSSIPTGFEDTYRPPEALREEFNDCDLAFGTLVSDDTKRGFGAGIMRFSYADYGDDGEVILVLEQKVSMLADPSICLWAETWRVQKLIEKPHPENIAHAIADLTKSFLKQYVEANK